MNCNKIDLHKDLNENKLEQTLSGMSVFEDLEDLNLFRLEAPVVFYSKKGGFFYAQFNDENEFCENKLCFAFEREVIVVSTRFCLIAKKDASIVYLHFYEGKVHKQKNAKHHKKIKDFISRYNDYYLGYEKRYKKVYESGGSTWESVLPNESLVQLYTRFSEYFIDKKVIDLGCGEGRDCIFLSKKGVSVLGVDISHTALEKARVLAKKSRVNATFMELNMLYLNGIDDQSFDTALSMGALHMIVDAKERKQHIQNVHRILKKGGRFVIDHCRKDWGKGFYSLPEYDKNKLVVGGTTDRKIRTEQGEKFIALEVLPYSEKEECDLTEEIGSCRFAKKYVLATKTQAFGNSVLMVFEKE